MAELTAQIYSHLGIGMRNKTERTKGRGGYGKSELGQDEMQPFACEKKRFSWHHESARIT